jgi:hypothetical protein
MTTSSVSNGAVVPAEGLPVHPLRNDGRLATRTRHRRHATEGRSWRLRLSRDGARAARLGAPAASEEDPVSVDASARGTASNLVLMFYGRIPLDSLKVTGDRRIFDQLIAWDPSV